MENNSIIQDVELDAAHFWAGKEKIQLFCGDYANNSDIGKWQSVTDVHQNHNWAASPDAVQCNRVFLVDASVPVNNNWEVMPAARAVLEMWVSGANKGGYALTFSQFSRAKPIFEHICIDLGW